MLNLLEASQIQRRARVLVGREPPKLGEELGVGLVAAYHPHRDRPLFVPADHQRRPMRLLARQMDARGIDPELGESGGHLRGRGTSAGRTEDEMDGGGHGPTKDQAAKDVIWQTGPEVERRDANGDTEELADAPGWTSQVRARRRHHSDHDGQAWLGKQRRHTDARDRLEAPGESLPRDPRTDAVCDSPRGDASHEEVASQSPPTPDHRRGHRQADSPQSARRVEPCEGRRPGPG